MITLENLSKVYGAPGTDAAVDDVSLTIGSGEICVLIGPSGCGKTTTMRMVNRLITPTGGRVLIDNQDTAAIDTVALRRSIGYVIQQVGLFPNMTVEENIGVVPRLLGWDRARTRTRAAELLDMVGLDVGQFLGRYPNQLSGGQQQRVGVARALAADPPVLLMDEPFSNLDRRMRDRVREETIALLRELGATTLIVTHDPEEAMRISDRIALLRDGVVIQIGTGEELYRNPIDIDAARFFCDFTELSGSVRGERVVSVLGEFVAPQCPESSTVTICVRPSGVRVSSSQSGISARILSQKFLGDIQFVEFGVQGLDGPLKARMRAEDLVDFEKNPKILIDQKEVLVFAA